MPFTLIKGTFHVVGFSPDGDSLKFRANNRSLWNKLTGARVEMNVREEVQLRFEGIDALETHFEGTHQPLDLAREARDLTLLLAGIREVKWGPAESKVVSARDGSHGYILARATEKNRRPVSFVYFGFTSRRDGSQVLLDADWVQDSINYKLLDAGLAYPTYYQGLFWDLRQVMSQIVTEARNAGVGLWPHDRSAGVPVANLGSITDEYVIFPKLFRRLAAYLKQHPNLTGFKEHLAAAPEPILILSKQHFTNLDTVIEVHRHIVKMTVPPEDLVFLT